MSGVEVVDCDGEVVEDGAVGARDHRVVEVLVAKDVRTADGVVDDRLAVVADAEAHRALAFLDAAEAALAAVLLLVAADVVGRGARAIGVTGVEQRSSPSPCRSERSLCMIGPSSQSSSSHSSASMICATFAGVERSRSVSSMRSTSSPSLWRASSQLKRAVRAPPMCSAPVGDGAKRTLIIGAMLIGAHVSPAGGLPKAIERGVERGCRAIQIFNQSPRMWRPTAYSDEVGRASSARRRTRARSRP